MGDFGPDVLEKLVQVGAVDDESVEDPQMYVDIEAGLSA